MTATFFVDTNVLIYAGSNADEDRAKRQIARDLLSRPGAAFSAQVLQEFHVVSVTKNRLQIAPNDALAVLQSLTAFPVCPISLDLVLAAVNDSQRFRIAYWDAAILAAARQLGCATVFSEDLNAGQDYDDVAVINPFVASMPS